MNETQGCPALPSEDGNRGVEETNEHEDATASMETGIDGQTLVVDGWFASRADTDPVPMCT